MHKLEYIIVKLLFEIFGHISFAAGKRIAWVFYVLVSKVFRYRRKTILDNLKLVYGSELPAPQQQLLSGIYKNFVYLWMEFLQLRRLRPENFDKHFKIHGTELIDEALKEGKGIIYMSGHYGNFEWMGQFYAMNGYPVNGIAKRQSNPYVNKFIEDIRRTNGANVVYIKNAMQEGPVLLAKNELFAIVADQDARHRGVFVDFLGQPSSTPVGPAVFQMRSGAPIFMIISVRKDYSKFEAFIEHVYSAEAREVTDEGILEITQLHTSVLEKWIRKYPDQWFWMHKRWKTKPAKKTI